MKFLITLTILSVIAFAFVTAVDEGTQEQRQALIDEGKQIYQKYIDGNFIDSDGIPDMARAPTDLQDQTSAWAEKVQNEGFDVDVILEEVEKAFM